MQICKSCELLFVDNGLLFATLPSQFSAEDTQPTLASCMRMYAVIEFQVQRLLILCSTDSVLHMPEVDRWLLRWQPSEHA